MEAELLSGSWIDYADDDPVDEEGRSMVVPGNDTSGFVGVDPMYQNYSTVIGAPLGEPVVAQEEVQEEVQTEESEPVSKKKAPAKE